MSWEIQKLEDVTTKIGDGLHGTPKYNENGDYFFINGNNFIQGRVQIKQDTKRIDYDEYLKIKKQLNQQTIFVAINGTLGNVALYNDENVALGKSACYLNIREDVSRDFVRYVLEDDKFQRYAQLFATGATIKNLGLKAVREFSFELPPLDTQKRIASILSTYDDLMENNLKRIKLLEETAQNIYKEWFVNFRFPNYEHTEFDAESGLPVGWEMKTFEEILDFKTGKLNSNANVVDGKYPFFTCSQEVFKTNTFSFDTEAVLLGGNNASANYPLKYFKGQFDAYQRTYIIKPKNNVISHKYIFLYLKERLNLLKQMSTGTSTKFLTLKMLNQMVLLVPDEISNNAFESIVNPIFDQILILQEQNEKLKEARDILLPRLMNRTIEV